MASADVRQDSRSDGTLRMILHGAARVYGCGSAQMAMVDEPAPTLVFRVAVANRDVEVREQVTSLLGFEPDGAAAALGMIEGSLLVRAVREGRTFLTGRFAELVGDVVPAEVSAR